jgi:non-ribosomal peptide synthetase component F
MTTLPDWLARCAANHPEKLAVRCGTTDWTFAELDRQATTLAQDLAAIGISAWPCWRRTACPSWRWCMPSRAWAPSSSP